MEVGDYIRTIDGYIRKIDNINIEKQKITYYGKYVLDIPYKNSQAVAEKKIKSHSKNIIDLIEVGDYVNGDEVIAIDYNEDENGNAFDVLGVYGIDDDYAYTIELSRIHIRTILTHEMYNQNCYKVGGD